MPRKADVGNLLLLVVFGIVAFNRNEPNLMHGLDETYFMTPRPAADELGIGTAAGPLRQYLSRE